MSKHDSEKVVKARSRTMETLHPDYFQCKEAQYEKMMGSPGNSPRISPRSSPRRSPKHSPRRWVSNGAEFKVATPIKSRGERLDSTEAKINELLDIKPVAKKNDEPRIMDNDPFKLFEVAVEPCHVMKVTVIEGRNISKGSLHDLMDVPDPYVIVHLRKAPDGKRQTRKFDNCTDPIWNEIFEFYLPPTTNTPSIAKITLMDANYLIDETIGVVEFDVEKVRLNEKFRKTFYFNETSEVEIEFQRYENDKYNLRSSLALCAKEKLFRKQRKRAVKDEMRNILEIGFPRTLRETPSIAIMGSGGGYRAMVGYSGAIRALKEIGVFDCATYTVGLSGSTWFMSQLYSHPSFPEEGTVPATQEMRQNISKNFIKLVKPTSLARYGKRLKEKMNAGQPVTFTDFFGLLVGEHILGPERMETACLSDFEDKIRDGKSPMPLMTCLHVRSDVSAMVYHEWIEFSPFEIGMAKYGTFVRTSDFNSKYFMGVISTHYKEAPLHFLMGVWGSAFSILFNRLVAKTKPGESGGKQKTKEVMNLLRQEQMQVSQNHEEDEDSDVDDSILEDDKEKAEEEKVEEEASSTTERKGWFGTLKGMMGIGTKSKQEAKPEVTCEDGSSSGSYLDSIIASVLQSKMFKSREYRAGKILNYMRGLSLNVCYPISPFTPSPEDKKYFFNSMKEKKETKGRKNEEQEKSEEGEEEDFHDSDKPMQTEKKKVFVVDAGLTFNSPYPAILRPQRTVDLILSFDFSARTTDDSNPFAELKLAEKWARKHQLPFPKIDEGVYEREGMKECYVFRDEEDERAPIILHFVLCNVNYKKYSAPGVLRDPEDKSGDFELFGENTPYSTFNFHYEKKNFDRLHNLIRFNTLLHKKTILDNIKECVNLRRRCETRLTISLKEIKSSLYLSSAKKAELLEKLGAKTDRIFLDQL